ncbi:MAG: hypothetical protein ACREE4_06435 [Stellaceae bacterium]
MCTFWLAHYRALRGECEKAEATLRRAEAAAGEKGLFSEAIDARSSAFLGNMPLLFSQVAYAKAALALALARPDARERSPWRLDDPARRPGRRRLERGPRAGFFAGRRGNSG